MAWQSRFRIGASIHAGQPETHLGRPDSDVQDRCAFMSNFKDCLLRRAQFHNVLKLEDRGLFRYLRHPYPLPSEPRFLTCRTSTGIRAGQHLAR